MLLYGVTKPPWVKSSHSSSFDYHTPVNEASAMVTTRMTSPILKYCQTCNISYTKSQNLKCFWSHLAVVFAQSRLKPVVKSRMEDLVGAAPTGDAPTTSEWSTILLPYIRGLTVFSTGSYTYGGFGVLTHWGLNKYDYSWNKIFSDTFLKYKRIVFW